MKEELYFSSLNGCGGFEYYLKFLLGFIVHLILPGLEHFIIFQNAKAIALCISSFIFRYIIVTLGSKFFSLKLVVAIYYVNTFLTKMVWLVYMINISCVFVFGLVLSNELSIFLDFNQLLIRLSHKYPIMKGEYTVQVIVLGAQFASPHFLTWFPVNAPNSWIEESRKTDEEVRKGK